MKKRTVLRIVKRALSSSRVSLLMFLSALWKYRALGRLLWLSEDVNQDGDGLIVDKGQLKIIMH